jgi:hypothetical protein
VFEPHDYTHHPHDPQTFSALRQDLPCISFDPLGDVARIAAVEGAEGCEAVVTLLDVATIAAVEKGDGCEASATLLDAFLEKARGADAQRAQQPKKLYFLYTDEAGIPLSREVRLQYPDGRKKTWQEAADPDRPGQWITGAGCVTGVRRVPFWLPGLIEALKAGETIFIVEGPRKCELLHEWGLAATCNMGGSGAASVWREHAREFFLPIYNSPVVILPDNDAPGAKSAATIADFLASVGVTVSLLDLPGLGPKGDIVDWERDGGTRQQFLDLVDAESRAWVPSEAPRWQLKVNSEGFAKAARAAKLDFPLIAFEDITFNLDEEWRVDRLFPLVGLVCLYGLPGSLKSFILQDLFLRMACGGYWGGREVRQCPVVYVAAEGSGGIKKRIVGLRKALVDKGESSAVPFSLITVAPNLGTGDGDCKKLIASIEGQLPSGTKPGAIALDTASQSMGGADENGAGMDMLVINATTIANHFQCLIVLVHHTPVSDDQRLRGKSSLRGGIDGSILSESVNGSKVATLTVMKMRDEDDAQSFTVRLKRIILGKTKKGHEVSTLVVETVEPGAASGGGAP